MAKRRKALGSAVASLAAVATVAVPSAAARAGTAAAGTVAPVNPVSVTHPSVAMPAGPATRFSPVTPSGTPTGQVQVEAPRLLPPGSGAVAGPSGAPAAASVRVAGPPIGVLTSFAGVDRAGERARFGIDAEPPDTQLAVGHGRVVEAVNSIVEVFDDSGTLLRAFGMPGLFGAGGTTGSFVTDPWVLFDPASGRWFLSAVVVAPTGSRVVLAVSAGQDPTGVWSAGTVSAGTGVVRDQPKVAVGAGKVVLGWNDFSLAGAFTGSEMFVLDEPELLAGSAAVATAGSGPPNPARYGLLPVSPPAGPGSVLVVFNGSGGPATGPGYVGVIAVTGTPAAGDTAEKETDVRAMSDGTPFTPTVPPPPAAQAGSGATLDSGDDRFLSAVQRPGRLWVTSGDTCSNSPTACIRLISFDPSAPAAGLTADYDVGAAGSSWYYPAITADGAGDLFLAFSESSSTLYPSLAVLETSADGASSGPDVLSAGDGPYGGSRWGDYSGAAADPDVPGDVWLAGEYQASSADPAQWGTTVARLTVSAPSVTSVTPASSDQSGGGTVSVSGTGFQAGATSVSFGSAPSPSVTVESPTTLVAAVPSAGGPGTVPVAVATPDGISGGGPGAELAYGPVPGQPGSVRARPGPNAGTATVTWNPPVDDGGSPVAGYVVTAWPSGISASVPPDRLTASLSGLPAATPQEISVAALNASGQGLDSAPSPFLWTGAGYWLVGADGGVFSFGDAGFFGSAGSARLAAPIVGMAASPDGGGYWLVGADGGVFSFGDAGFLGSARTLLRTPDVVALAPTRSGRGYWVVGSDGGMFSFGDARFFGAATGAATAPVRGAAGLAG